MYFHDFIKEYCINNFRECDFSTCIYCRFFEREKDIMVHDDKIPSGWCEYRDGNKHFGYYVPMINFVRHGMLIDHKDQQTGIIEHVFKKLCAVFQPINYSKARLGEDALLYWYKNIPLCLTCERSFNVHYCFDNYHKKVSIAIGCEKSFDSYIIFPHIKVIKCKSYFKINISKDQCTAWIDTYKCLVENMLADRKRLGWTNHCDMAGKVDFEKNGIKTYRCIDCPVLTRCISLTMKYRRINVYHKFEQEFKPIISKRRIIF